ncbi:hypothetical protein DPEC_G00151160 [Dallia pectoralis]|uniref:Uncharacterized protein n=1 Tax=Dallia pectoralis TaxID=75939 RepID=A0ACC2GJI3_DALPE|nr:hypothetical protein DPEC_G00151160 [Dallia pectoralis]
MSEEKPKEGVKTENDHINLKVAGQDGSVVQFKIKRHTPLSKLMKAYCERQGLSIRQIRFRFDGQPINETDTPAQLEMEDEDTIDVFQQQTGSLAQLQTPGDPAQTLSRWTSCPVLSPGGGGISGRGVNLVHSGGVRGVRLSHPRHSLGFPSSQILGNCQIFPREFSIITTLKVTRVAPKKSEYIFSLVAEKEEGDDGKEHRGGETQEGNDVDRDAESDLKGNVGGDRKTDEESSKRHGKGLIRQLVLVAGGDATPRVCPSSNPRLAELSVPALLLDMPVKEADVPLPSYGTVPPVEAGVRVSVGLERSCSDSFVGQLWFHPIRRSLHLCDGALWVPVMHESRRLDYVLEHQVLSTSSETYDVELWLIVPPHWDLLSTSGERGAFAFTRTSAHTELFPGHILLLERRWNEETQKFLTTHCARDWEAFRIQGKTFLAVANHRQGNTNHTIDSVIYKWNRGTRLFEPHQALQTSGAYDWESFTVGPYHFLAVANAFDGLTTQVDSVIYIWVDGRFLVFQTIKTFCATDWEMFQIGSRVFLVVANGRQIHGNNIGRYAINSTIYELNISSQLFVRFQDIFTYSAIDWEFFTVGEDSYLVVANYFDGESYSLNSIIYRWQGYGGFVPIHCLPTIGCSDWEFFKSGGESLSTPVQLHPYLKCSV